MSKIEIFDPAMCCSTGVCGPSIDPELLRVATTINKLTAKGVDIVRHGLSNEPEAFITNKKINDYLVKEETKVLPITIVDGEVVKTHTYPTAEEFAKWSGVALAELSAPAEKKKDSGCCCSDGCC